MRFLTKNQKTIAAYNESLDEYAAGTPDELSGAGKAWLDWALALASKRRPVLEIGSGLGRDAAYMEARGFTVRRTDAAHAFVKHQRTLGFEADVLNVLTDSLGGPYGFIYANGVFPHLSECQQRHAVRKIARSLTDGGVFAFSVKVADHTTTEQIIDKISRPRYYRLREQSTIMEFSANVQPLLFESRLIPAGFFPYTSARGSHWIGVAMRRVGKNDLAKLSWSRRIRLRVHRTVVQPVILLQWAWYNIVERPSRAL